MHNKRTFWWKLRYGLVLPVLLLGLIVQHDVFGAIPDRTEPVAITPKPHVIQPKIAETAEVADVSLSITLTPDTQSLAANAGDMVEFTHIAYNSGDRALTLELSTSYISPELSQIELRFVNISGDPLPDSYRVKPGESVRIRLRVKSQDTTSAGKYDITVKVDYYRLGEWKGAETVTDTVEISEGPVPTPTFTPTPSPTPTPTPSPTPLPGMEDIFYMPVVFQGYWWKPLSNGDFDEELTAWTKEQVGLPVTALSAAQERGAGETGENVLLLGDTGYACDGVPVGHAAVEQTFSVPYNATQLKFDYIIWSQDASVSDSYDRFEVFLWPLTGMIPDTPEVADGNLDFENVSCDNWHRVPAEFGSWKTGIIDIRDYQNSAITVSFRVYSRYDNYYNTYAYLDNVRIITDPSQ